jgi:hypothetical protein
VSGPSIVAGLDSTAFPPPSTHRTPVAPLLFIGVTVVASLVILMLQGAPAIAFAPVLAVTGIYAMRWVQFRQVVFLLFMLVIAAEIGPHPIADGAGAPTWKSPLFPLEGLLLDNLNSTFNVPSLHFAGTELCLAVLLIALCIRWMANGARAVCAPVPMAQPMVTALAASLVAIFVLEVEGVAHGGDVRQSLWQFRALVWLPVVVTLLAHSMRDTRDLRILAWVITFTAFMKGTIGLYYYFRYAKPNGFQPHSITSHADTTLFVGTITMWVAAAVARPSRATILRAAAVFAYLLVVIIENNRRTAYVSLAASFAAYIALLPNLRLRRFLRRAVYWTPLLVAYLVIGRNRSDGIFAPAADVFSVSNQEDDSSMLRDIENQNLIYTLRTNIVSGTGWGHEYNEVIPGGDISAVFAQYRFIAHNSVLWLLSIGGVVGFTAMWMPIPIGIFLAVRSYRMTDVREEMAAAAAAVAMYLIFMIQAWSDMAAGSWTCTLLLAAAFVTSGKLATRTGAWPAGVPVFWSVRPRIRAGDWRRLRAPVAADGDADA